MLNAKEAFLDREVSWPPGPAHLYLSWVENRAHQDIFNPETNKKLTLGEMFQTIPEQAVIVRSEHVNFSSSTRDLLIANACEKFFEFSRMHPSDLLGLSGADSNVVREVISTLFFEATNWFMNQETNSSNTEESHKELVFRGIFNPIRVLGRAYKNGHELTHEQSMELSSELDDFYFRAMLQGYKGHEIPDVLNNESLGSFKGEILHQFDTSSWFRTATFPSLEGLLSDFIGQLDSRDQQILYARSSLSNPLTLDQIGQQLGLTRERVRQLEVRYRKDFKKFSESNPLIQAFYQVFLSSFDGFAFVESLNARFPFLGNQIEGTELCVVDLFAYSTDDLNSFDGIISNLAKSKFATEIRSFLDKISNNEEVHSISYFLDEFRTRWKLLTEEDVERVLVLNGFKQVMGFWLNNKASGIQDIAVAVLKHASKPLSPEEIMEKAEIVRSLSSFRNALLTDPRLQRTSVGKFGLTAWGLPVYSTINEAIGEYIDSKGSTQIEQLVMYLTETFEVTDGSVRTYASAFPFETVNGYVRRTNIKSKAKKPPHKVKKLFRDGDTWLFRIAVNSEILRGSGTSLPPILGDHLGITNNGEKVYKRGVDRLRITFPALNVTLSSIRKLCEGEDAKDGDFVFLAFNGESFDFWKANLDHEASKLNLLELIGCRNPSQSTDFLDELRNRLFLKQSVTSSDVRAILEKRKETEILEILDSNPNLLIT